MFDLGFSSFYPVCSSQESLLLARVARYSGSYETVLDHK